MHKLYKIIKINKMFKINKINKNKHNKEHLLSKSRKNYIKYNMIHKHISIH